ncbi:hypothetical protein [Bacillus subtilis]|uniref:hypothetical protein n=1 Tax=Bacillus subtilis TaxID=1423 RepID=UPI00089E07F4|nr:hypothetical protein [Bacillus subtilis]AOY05578.1 hypothetical protein BKN48_09575 [Bacillus subtilis]
MKKIRCLEDFEAIASVISGNFLSYLKQEFYGLYDYLSNGEKIDEFILESNQAMILLEEREELNEFLKSFRLNLEFMEEVKLKNFTFLRIGIFCDEDVQLCYAVK